MRVPIRIAAPVLLALFCALILMGFLWWQLSESTKLLQTVTPTTNNEIIITQPSTIDQYGIGSEGDKALMHLRQGDLFALRGDWLEAQEEYEKSVEAGGELHALKKLAQAQLQRRDLKGVSSTIKKMKAAGAKVEDLLLLESIVDLRKGELVKARKILDGAQESPQKHYGLALLGIIEGTHDRVQEELKLVANGWEPILRAYAKTLQAAYNEYALFPESPEIHLITLLSRALAQVQECELALPLLVQVTQQKDDYRDAWIVQGYCQLVTERPEQALASLEQAYNTDPQKPEIQYFLGRAYANLGDPLNAIIFFEYAAANGFTPEEEVRHYIAKEALRAGKGELALQQYAILVDMKDAPFETFEGFIATGIALGQNEQAEIAAQEAVKRWPKKGKAHELLGNAKLANEKLDEAKTAFQKAIELDPFLLDAKEKLEDL